jgi:hypothetical protein
LNISVAAYHKIEKQETKLTVERLLQIQHVLNTTIADFFDVKTENIYHQTLKDNAVGYQEVQNIYQDNRDINNRFIESLQNEISFLRKQLENNNSK